MKFQHRVSEFMYGGSCPDGGQRGLECASTRSSSLYLGVRRQRIHIIGQLTLDSHRSAYENAVCLVFTKHSDKIITRYLILV